MAGREQKIHDEQHGYDADEPPDLTSRWRPKSEYKASYQESQHQIHAPASIRNSVMDNAGNVYESVSCGPLLVGSVISGPCWMLAISFGQ